MKLIFQLGIVCPSCLFLQSIYMILLIVALDCIYQAACPSPKAKWAETLIPYIKIYLFLYNNVLFAKWKDVKPGMAVSQTIPNTSLNYLPQTIYHLQITAISPTLRSTWQHTVCPPPPSCGILDQTIPKPQDKHLLDYQPINVIHTSGYTSFPCWCTGIRNFFYQLQKNLAVSICIPIGRVYEKEIPVKEKKRTGSYPKE